MDLGWATTRGRARWGTVLGIVTAVALIGGSLIALNRSVLPFDAWPTSPPEGAETQRIPDATPVLHRDLEAAVELLAAKRNSLHDAQHEAMEALGEMIWESQRSGLPPDGHAYLDKIRS